MIGTNPTTFGRLVTAMPTPFQADLNIDFPAVERVVNHLIETGTQSIVVNGTCGESPTLEENEKHELLKHVIASARGRAKIIMGAGSNSTKHAVESSQAAEKIGADGVLSVVPYYNKPSQSGLIEHFSRIASSTSLPIILYNIPGRTGLNMSVETTIELASSFPNIVALKDCFGSTDQAAEIARLGPPHFRIYTGDDYLILPTLAVGGCGVVSTAGSLLGSSIAKMMDFFVNGHLDQARELYFRCLPIFKGLFIAPNPTCLKYAMAKQGLCGSALRPPLVALDQTQRSTIDKLLLDSPLDPVAQKLLSAHLEVQ